MLTTLIVLTLAAAVALPVLRSMAASGRLPRPLAELVDSLGPVRPVQLVCLAGVLVAVEVVGPEGGRLVMGLLVAALLLAYVALWVHEFRYLMSLTDADFPGRYDKPIWAAALILLGPLGLWVFRRYRTETWAEPAAGQASAPAGKHAPLHDWF